MNKKRQKNIIHAWSNLNKILVLVIILEILYISFNFLNSYIYKAKQGDSNLKTVVQCLEKGQRYTIDEAIKNPAACDVEISIDKDFVKLTTHSKYLANVRTIYFRKTSHTTIPSEIADLRNLRVLNFHHTFNTSLPPEISNLQNLTDLKIDQADIKSIPEEIGNLSNLVNLTIITNTEPITLPQEINNLKKLKSLALYNNPGVTLPDNIADMSNLEEINLSDSNMKTIPSGLKKMINLRLLNLNGNNLTKQEIADLKRGLPNTNVVY